MPPLKKWFCYLRWISFRNACLHQHLRLASSTLQMRKGPMQQLLLHTTCMMRKFFLVDILTPAFFRRSVFRSTSEGSLLSKVLPRGRVCISDSIELYFRCWIVTVANNHIHAYADRLRTLTRAYMRPPKFSTDWPTNEKGGLCRRILMNWSSLAQKYY